MKRIGVKDSSKGRDLIDTFVDKDFNTRRDEIEETLVGLRYHTSLHFLRHFVVLEGIIKDFLSKDIPKIYWLKKLGELFAFYFIGWTKRGFSDYRSMRKVVEDLRPEPLTESERNLLPLQLGR